MNRFKLRKSGGIESMKGLSPNTQDSRLVSLPPPSHVPPPNNKALWSGLINHWFPLIRPKIKPLFLGGGTLGGGWLNSHVRFSPNTELSCWAEVRSRWWTHWSRFAWWPHKTPQKDQRVQWEYHNLQENNWAAFKTLMTFHYTGWLIGTLIMAY